MAKLEEITATYIAERHRFDNADGDVIIGLAYLNSGINKEITIKGQADLDELKPDQTYRFYGRFTTYKNKRSGVEEEQFTFDSFIIQAPHGREGVVGYIRAAGEGHGLGQARAAKLWEWYGSEAVVTLREQPEAVAQRLTDAGLKLKPDDAKAIAAILANEQALEGCTLDLMDLLIGRGFPKGTARRAVKEWGNKAATIIRRNPYLMMKRFPGCGFKRCDSLYMDLRLPPHALKRQALCAWYAVASDTDGHTWFPTVVAEQGIKQNIGGAEIQIEKARELARRARWTTEIRSRGNSGPLADDGDRTWIAEHKKAKHESDMALAISQADGEELFWPDVAKLREIEPRVSDHQLAELAKALRGPIGVLGGGPGTGKTFLIAVLVKLLGQAIGLQNVLIGAPTGKAAVRVTENLSAYGLPIKARTWHSQLACLGASLDLENANGGSSPFFPQKVLIGDESSMNDTDLAAAIFRARAVGAHVLLVGDVNQLPPVGHGAPLRDLIAAGLPYGELQEIKRNSGGIVEACAMIRQGKRWEAGDNLIHVETESADEQIDVMMRAIQGAIGNGRDGRWDVQVVVPVNAKSKLSRKELNKLLQNSLNPEGGRPGTVFRKGDKIVNTKNGYFPQHTGLDIPETKLDKPSINAGDPSDDPFAEEVSFNPRGEVYVANGELAEVLAVEEKLIVAKLSNPRRVIRIPRGKQVEEEQPAEGGEDDKATGTGCSWDLGYALSVHRSQGSEWPVVICMIDEYPGARFVCSREYWYTAISRAKEKCVLIGKRSVVDQGCKRLAISKRKTFLKELILRERSARELANL